jgi:hypothetical protein
MLNMDSSSFVILTLSGFLKIFNPPEGIEYNTCGKIFVVKASLLPSWLLTTRRISGII